MFADWDVKLDPKTLNYPGAWYLVVVPSGLGPERLIDIGPETLTYEQATDAALEFMDRLRCRAVPKTLDDPRELMSMCVRNMRRQR
jgi:hypothetical protein